MVAKSSFPAAPWGRPHGSVASQWRSGTHGAPKPSAAPARPSVRPTAAPSAAAASGVHYDSRATLEGTDDEESVSEVWGESSGDSGDEDDNWDPHFNEGPDLYGGPYNEHAAGSSAATYDDPYGPYRGETQDVDEGEESENESRPDSDIDEFVDVDYPRRPPTRMNDAFKANSVYTERNYGRQSEANSVYHRSSSNYTKQTPSMQEQKSRLPIQEQSSKVLPLLCGESPVCCLHGETGCGKSTQVPQMILEDATERGLSVRIAVTQPRRVAAINLAKRVAEELGEDGPGGTVGFRIGGENTPGQVIDFCTVGYLLQLFTNVPEEFGRYTHIVLDEVHERTAESDMLCLVVRLLVSIRFHETRVTVMSGTLQGDLFADYFGSLAASSGGPTRVSVGARCFPVETYFLEDIGKAFGSRLQSANMINKLILQMFPTNDSEKKKKPEKIKPNHVEKLQVIIVDLIRCVAEKGTTILIFLPGIAEISTVWEEARGLEESKAFRVFPLHSMIPREEQELVFQDPEPSVTNVVLATDIAESSVTLPNVVAVFDFGLHRRIDHDPARGVSALATKWISRAAATQRSGRAGRTRPGLCLRLYTRDLHENSMEAFEPPESASMPLDKLYLSAKQLCEKLTRALGSRAPHSAETVLLQLIQPPELTAIAKARDFNAELGIITMADETATITSLGRLCLQLPIDLQVARLVWLGCHMGVAADAVVLAAVLSSLDAFTAPSPLFMRDEWYFLERLQQSTSCRGLFDGGQLSEPLMMRQLFREWLVDFHESEDVWGSKDYIFRARRRHTGNFVHKFSLSKGRMEHMISQVLDLALRTIRLCEPQTDADFQLRGLIAGLGYEVNEKGDLSGMPFGCSELEGIFEEDTAYLKGLLAAAFSDQLLIGSYGAVPRDLDAPKAKLDKQEALLKAIVENDLQPRRTLVLPGGMEEPEAYVDFVCGKISKPSISVTVGGNKWSLVELEERESVENQLKSAFALEESDDLRRLPRECALLFSFQAAMRELEKAKASSSWTHGPVDMQHPCRLYFEWMNHVFVGSSGSNGKKQKAPKIVRCEASCEKKNPLGFVAHVPDLEDDAGMRNIATFAVAAQVRGCEVPGRVFPSGVTMLSPGHVAFLLATMPLKGASFGLKSAAFTTSGCLAVLHRSISLPKSIIDSKRWALICKLRDALHDALVVPELPENLWMHGRPGTLLTESPVGSIARDLFQHVPWSQSSGEAYCDESLTSVAALAAQLVELPSHGRQEGAAAFWPLASWEELTLRRTAVQERKTMMQNMMQNMSSWQVPPPAKRQKLNSGTAQTSAQTSANIGRMVVLKCPSWFGPPGVRVMVNGEGEGCYFTPNGLHLYFAHEGHAWEFCSPPNSAPVAPSPKGNTGQNPVPAAPPPVLLSKKERKKANKQNSLTKLCNRVWSSYQEIQSQQECELLVSTLEALEASRLDLNCTKGKAIKKVLKWARGQKLPPTGQLSRVAPLLDSIKQAMASATTPSAGPAAAETAATNPPAAASSKAESATRKLPEIPHSREELLKFSNSGLKELLKLRGLSASGCIEKSDLVDKLLGSTA